MSWKWFAFAAVLAIACNLLALGFTYLLGLFFTVK